MPPNLLQLIQQRAAALDAANAINNAAVAAGRELTDEETAQVQAKLDEAKEIKGKIDAEQARVDARAAVLASLSEETDALDQDAARPRSRGDAPGDEDGDQRQPARRSAAPAPGSNQRRPASVVDRSQRDPRRGFRSMGEFAMSVMQGMTPGGNADARLRALSSFPTPGSAATGMSQGVGADGGFLVPPEFASTIWDGMNVSPDNLLARTDQYTVEGESLSFPANAETSRATGSRYGGVKGFWLSEAAQIQNSKPTFRMVKLEPSQLGVLVYVTDKLLRNSPIALEQYVNRAAVDEILFLVGDSIINGIGAGKPKGIVQSASRVSIAKETNQAAGTIVKANIDKMWARMHPKSRANAVWFINVDCEPQLENLSMVVGTGGVPVYLPPGGITDTPNARLKGRPVIPIEYAASCGTEGDIILGDMKAYVSGVQGGLESAMSMHLRFDYAETAFRFLFAVDGQPWLASPITPFKGTNTLAPFVTLAAR